MSIDPILVTIAGKRFWRDPADGRTVPFVGGGSEPVEDPPADPPAPPAPKADEPTLTQSQVDAIVQREKAKAQKAADKAAADAIAAAKADADKAAMTEAERAKTEANEAKAEAASLKAEVAAERLALKVERKLLAAGVPDAAIARAARLVSLDADASDDDIATEVDTLKTELPALFAATADGTPPKPGVAVPPKPPKAQSGGTPKEIAHQRLVRMGIVKPDHPTAA